MKEISLHILDIFNNSLQADASLIEVSIDIDEIKDLISVIIKDNGCGMDEDFLETIENPFTTTRSARSVGLGVPFLKQAAIMSDGRFRISSQKGVGTEIFASFQIDNIDRMPIGNIIETVAAMVISLGKDCDLLFTQIYNGHNFDFDTRQMREVLGQDIPLSEPMVVAWVKKTLDDEYQDICCNTDLF